MLHQVGISHYFNITFICCFISLCYFTYATLDTVPDKEHCRYLHRRHKCTDVGYIFKPYFCLKNVLLFTLGEAEYPLYDICFGTVQFFITRVLCAKLHPADRCHIDVKQKTDCNISFLHCNHWVCKFTNFHSCKISVLKFMY